MLRRQKYFRFAFFAVNFSVSVFLFLASIVGIAAGAINNPGAFLGGVVLLVPSGLYAIGEWLAYYRNRRLLERPLGALNLCGAAFMGLSLVKEVADSIIRNEPAPVAFYFWFALAFGVTATYLAACAWFRLRLAERATEVDVTYE